MKSRVSYSRFATISTAFLFGALFVGCIATVKNEPMFFSLLFIYVVLFVMALFFGAAYIKADANHIVLGSLLRGKKINMDDVESVELFKPTMGAIRICGSGGFMGFWGLFRESDIGKYYAFYGKASDCFLVRLKNGTKYVLGCQQPDKMVAFINSHLSN